MPAEERLQALIEGKRDDKGRPLRDDLRAAIHTVSAAPSGVPRNVSLSADDSIVRRARVVENIVERNPDEPTLEEVREMMLEIEEELAEIDEIETAAAQ